MRGRFARLGIDDTAFFNCALRASSFPLFLTSTETTVPHRRRRRGRNAATSERERRTTRWESSMEGRDSSEK